MFEDIINVDDVDRIVSKIRSYAQSTVDAGLAIHYTKMHQKRVVKALLDKGIQVMPVDGPVVILDGDSLLLRAYKIDSSTDIEEMVKNADVVFIRRWIMSCVKHDKWYGFGIIELAWRNNV